MIVGTVWHDSLQSQSYRPAPSAWQTLRHVQRRGDPAHHAIALLLFVGATGKSAQIPLYVWLPDAMEGPTPVSALIHAATMVTAGVYMVARMNAIYQLAPAAMAWSPSSARITAIFAASMALVQTDIKRVLAYSTISQLGYMFLALGVGAFTAGIFHLMTHAFFKAPALPRRRQRDPRAVRRTGHAQNGRRSRKRFPSHTGPSLIATLAIAGIPPFAGFFSKDEILGQPSTFQRWTLLFSGPSATSPPA